MLLVSKESRVMLGAKCHSLKSINLTISNGAVGVAIWF
jgi:hypothetical protein